MKKSIPKSMLTALFMVLLMVFTSSMSNVFGQGSPDLTVGVNCSTSGIPVKNERVDIFAVGVDGNPINPCACNLNKCVVNPVKTGMTGPANGQKKGRVKFIPAGLAPETSYTAVVGAKCTKVNPCNNNPQANCHFTFRSQQAFVTNAMGGSNTPVLISDAGCRIGNWTTGISSVSTSLEAFPNPAAQQVTINVADYEGKVQLQVVDILGQQIIIDGLELTGQETYIIDISSLAPGIYKVILISDSDLAIGTFVKATK